MLNFIKKLRSKSKDSFGDVRWKYDKERDSKAPVLSWFFTLPKGSKILEGGSGVGNYMVSLSKMGHHVYGIEIDPERVKIARGYLKEYAIDPTRAKVGDLLKIPYPDNSFDAVFCHGVIEHIEDSEKAVKEIARVLKKGGHAMISVPNRYTSFTLSKIILQSIDKIFKTKLWNVGYEKSFPPRVFGAMIQRNLEIIDFRRRPVQQGSTFPLYGKILRALDLPFQLLNVDGGWLYTWSRKR